MTETPTTNAAGQPVATQPATPVEAATAPTTTGPVPAGQAEAGGPAVASNNPAQPAQSGTLAVDEGNDPNEMILINTLPTPDGQPSRAAGFVTRAEADKMAREQNQLQAQRNEQLAGEDAGKPANETV